MDRYTNGGFDDHVLDPNGSWVKHSDALKAIQEAQIEMARCNREGDDAVIRMKNAEIDKLKSLLNELSLESDCTIKYNTLQVDKDTWEEIKRLRGEV